MRPKRSLDTMSEAIALSSPSGRMSKRARIAAEKRLHEALFGDGILEETITEEEKSKQKRETLLRSAATLRDLAARGMSTRKFLKAAERLEKEARRYENSDV